MWYNLGPPANITNPVPGAPSLTDRERLVCGGPVEYSCDASGSPDPTITWYYNGAVVQSGSGGVDVDDGTLTIPAPQVSHSGIYQCFARNQFGEDSRAWILEVADPGNSNGSDSLQRTPSNPATLGASRSVLIREVAAFPGMKITSLAKVTGILSAHNTVCSAIVSY